MCVSFSPIEAEDDDDERDLVAHRADRKHGHVPKVRNGRNGPQPPVRRGARQCLAKRSMPSPRRTPLRR